MAINFYSFKGLNIATFNTLPSSGNVGDIIYYQPDATFKYWDGDKWTNFNGLIVSGTVAGENLNALEPVYISKGNANGDIGRVAGQMYKVDPTNDNRMEFIGLVRSSVLAGESSPIICGGEIAIPINLISGGAFVNGEFVYWNGTQYTTTVPTNLNFWLIKVGKAISNNKIMISPDMAASAVYVPAPPSALPINNNVTFPAILPISFNPTTTQAFKIHYQIRRIAGSTENSESGVLSGHYNNSLGQWFLINHSIAGDAFVAFSMSGNSIAYTSSNMTGTPYSGEMMFNIESTLDWSDDQSAAIANNVTSYTPITGLSFSSSTKGVLIFYSVVRSTSSPPDEKSESGFITLSRNGTSSLWNISVWGISGDAGILFDITPGGAVRYTTDNMTGSGYNGTIIWEIINQI